MKEKNVNTWNLKKNSWNIHLSYKLICKTNKLRPFFLSFQNGPFKMVISGMLQYKSIQGILSDLSCVLNIFLPTKTKPNKFSISQDNKVWNSKKLMLKLIFDHDLAWVVMKVGIVVVVTKSIISAFEVLPSKNRNWNILVAFWHQKCLLELLAKQSSVCSLSRTKFFLVWFLRNLFLHNKSWINFWKW